MEKYLIERIKEINEEIKEVKEIISELDDEKEVVILHNFISRKIGELIAYTDILERLQRKK